LLRAARVRREAAVERVDPSELRFLNPEVRALIAGIQGATPESTELDWDRLVRLAVAHGVAPLLHREWAGHSEVPRAVLDEFVRIRRQSALNGVLGICERDELLRLLNHEQVRFLVLKGAALARSWYGDISLRPFLDIDLWVPESQLPQAHQALARAGYKPMSHPGAIHHEVPLHRSGSPCSVELHHRLTFLPLLRVLRFEDFYARGTEVEATDGCLRTLSPEDTLVHLCLHCLADMAYTHGWRLRHLVDIRQHVEAFAVDWPEFAERATALGVRRACGAVLGLAALVAGAQIPADCIDAAATIDLLHHPMPGAIAHHRAAAFLAALRRGNPRLAVTVLLEKMADGRRAGHWNLRELRPYLLLPAAFLLLREMILEPNRLETQLRDWMPETQSWERTDELVADLLSAPGGGLPVDHVSPHFRVVKGEAAKLQAGEPAADQRESVLPLLRLVVLCVALAVLSSMLGRYVVRTVRVRGSSMEPTLYPGERLLVNILALRRRPLQVGSIVVVRDPRNHHNLAVKRVMGVAGQVVRVRRGRVYVDGRILDHGHPASKSASTWGPATVPPQHYFVLGDNQAVSVDSRSWGFLPHALIVGTVELAYWPPARWGRVSGSAPDPGR